MKKAHAIKLWLAIIIFAAIGQVAWVVENEFFSVFVYEILHEETTVNAIEVIAWMIGASAITGTLTTLLIGALSDKIGKRKTLISVGYIVWGLSIMSFALINVENCGRLFGTVSAASTTALIVIIADCLMTFFGASANEAGFNAWITDISTKENGGIIEGVLAIAPVLALIFVFTSSFFVDGGSFLRWQLVYIALGFGTLVAGVLGFFLLEDSKKLAKNTDGYWRNLISGFRIKTIKKHAKLYLILITFFLFCLATEISLPYLFIYLHYDSSLLISNHMIVFISGIALLVASVVSILYGHALDRFGTKHLLAPAILVFFVGLFILALPLFNGASANLTMIIIGVVLMFSGNFMVATHIGMLYRDETPKTSVGVFQGIRVLATVLLPMTIGPWVGARIIQNTFTFVELGETTPVPTPWVFLTSALVLLLMIIPVFFLHKLEKKEEDRHEPVKE
ncbi:MAG: MFS transporter [Firmicutes bacterium]|nr:MFS transporter [Bacillota bacterium]